MNTLRQFALWVNVPIEQVNNKKILVYIDFLIGRGLQPKTINSHLDSIRGFYQYLCDEEEVIKINPVKRGYALRLPQPLPRYLKDEEVQKLFAVINRSRDLAMFYLMLRCGLRVEEVANLCVAHIDFKGRKILVKHGKGGKDRIVYVSNDALYALIGYLQRRYSSRSKRVFLVEKGRHKGKSISVRGIQKRMEYYGRKAKVQVCCHQLRHTMATQLLNADADLVSIQDLLGHSRIKTTQRYSKVSNVKVQRDYFKAMEEVIQKSLGP